MTTLKELRKNPRRHLFRNHTIDLRENFKGEYGELVSRRCGVACRNCEWRGWRKLAFVVDLNKGFTKFDAVKITSTIKGIPSFEGCPSCSGRGWKAKLLGGVYESPIVFTHIPR